MVLSQDFNPNTPEAEADGTLWVWGQLGQQSEFQDRSATMFWEMNNKQENSRVSFKELHNDRIMKNYEVTLLMEVSVPPGPTTIQSQRNTQRSIVIINWLAY